MILDIGKNLRRALFRRWDREKEIEDRHEEIVRYRITVQHEVARHALQLLRMALTGKPPPEEAAEKEIAGPPPPWAPPSDTQQLADVTDRCVFALEAWAGRDNPIALAMLSTIAARLRARGRGLLPNDPDLLGETAHRCVDELEKLIGGERGEVDGLVAHHEIERLAARLRTLSPSASPSTSSV